MVVPGHQIGTPQKNWRRSVLFTIPLSSNMFVWENGALVLRPQPSIDAAVDSVIAAWSPHTALGKQLAHQLPEDKSAVTVDSVQYMPGDHKTHCSYDSYDDYDGYCDYTSPHISVQVSWPMSEQDKAESKELFAYQEKQLRERKEKDRKAKEHRAAKLKAEREKKLRREITALKKQAEKDPSAAALIKELLEE